MEIKQCIFEISFNKHVLYYNQYCTELFGETLLKLWVLMVPSLIGVLSMHKLCNWKYKSQLLFVEYFRTFQRSKKKLIHLLSNKHETLNGP